MATTGIVNGTAFGVYIGSSNNLIAFGTSCSISINHSPRNTTTSNSGAYTSRMAGTIDWDASCDSLIAMSTSSATAFYQMFATYLDTRQVLSIKFKTTVSGDKYFEGLAIMTGLSMDAPNEESATMSVSFAAAGPLSLGTV
tara:strand:+ start:654 stop:1076 length:423 start_codon:yes stop_codon:yes gene_type:complete